MSSRRSLQYSYRPLVLHGMGQVQETATHHHVVPPLLELNASECLWCTNRSMIHWICGINEHDYSNSASMMWQPSSTAVGRLHWFGHEQHALSCIKQITDFTAPGCRGRGRNRKKWEKCFHNDVDDLHLSVTDPQDRVVAIIPQLLQFVSVLHQM